jgi:mannose-1-phosphate guanylyltransferase
MAGGRGERFWPESRTARPKQLLPIVGEKAMLAQTIDRLADLVPAKDVFVITNTEQRDAVLEVCPELDPNKVIGEPVGRDTAAAVGLATRASSPRRSRGCLCHAARRCRDPRRSRPVRHPRKRLRRS